MERQLEKRIRYFFCSQYRGRADVRSTLHELQGLGRLVLIGGMLRDLAMFGNAHFRSDIDFVIDPVDPDHFEARMSSLGAEVNRFGGYALPFRKWQVDVWPLQKTWAHSAGHVMVNTFDDLKKVTFFGCDAILYDVSRKKLSARQGYFDDLQRRMLEINLRPNPNPVGNAVRAFRYAILKGFRWGPGLTKFIAETIEEAGWNGLIEYEHKSFNTRYIMELDQPSINRQLRLHISGQCANPFNLSDYQKVVQLELPLMGSKLPQDAKSFVKQI